MVQTGLVSITFRQHSRKEIVQMAAQAQLDCIEWGGDIHVPCGDLAAAREALALTHQAQMSVAAYGSYYRAGHSPETFPAVLRTALALEAPVIRVWAGTQNPEDADENYRRSVTEDLRRICELSARAEVLVALEFHRGTLTNTALSTRQLLEEVNHPQLKTLWQPRVDATFSEAQTDLETLAPWLEHLHVFQWHGTQRRPLAEGAQAWPEYLRLASSSTSTTRKTPIAALLEFVREDAPAQFFEDAQQLHRWIAALNAIKNPAN